MEITAFEEFIKNCREEFRWHIKGYMDGSLDLKNMLKGMLDRCCSTYEEETLKENLQEEFKNYMNDLIQEG